MKQSLLFATILAASVFPARSSAQKTTTVAKPDMICADCGNPGNPGGPGGGGGGGTNPHNQGNSCQAVSFANVAFTSPSTSGSQFHAGGTSGREGVGSVVAGGLNWIVATDRTLPDGNGNYALRLFQNSTGIGYGISALSYITDIYGSQLYAASNPALTSDGASLYLSWVDAAGILHWVKSITTVQSGNIQWGQVVNNQASLPYIYSPFRRFQWLNTGSNVCDDI